MATTEVQEQDPTPRAPSRRRRPVLAGVVATALVVTAGAVVLAQDSITSGDGTSMVVVREAPPADLGDFSGDQLDVVTEVTNLYGTEHHVAPADGRYLDLVVPVSNEGLLPVRLTDVLPTLATPGAVDVLDDVQVTVPVDPSQSAWRPVGDGVVVDPGESVPIRMTGRLDTACGSEVPPVEAGGGTGTDRFVDLRYTVLGLPRHADPVTTWTVVFDGPLGCPS